jgi:DNA repair protein RadC
LPSDADIKLTKQIKKALQTIHVTLHDHFIVSAGGWYPMAKEGML